MAEELTRQMAVVVWELQTLRQEANAVNARAVAAENAAAAAQAASSAATAATSGGPRSGNVESIGRRRLDRNI